MKIQLIFCIKRSLYLKSDIGMMINCNGFLSRNFSQLMVKVYSIAKCLKSSAEMDHHAIENPQH